MELTNYLDYNEEIIQFAFKNGASQIQIAHSISDDFDVEVRQGEIQQFNKAISKSMGMKVLVDDRVATASTSDLRKEVVENLVLSTIQRAKYSEADPYARLAELEQSNINSSSLNLYDPKIEELSPDWKISQAKEMESIALSDKRITNSLGSQFSTNISSIYLSNSNGFAGSFKSSSVSAGVFLQAGVAVGAIHELPLQSGASDELYEEGWWENRVALEALPPIEEIAKTAIHRTTRLIGAKKIESQKLPIIFEPNIAAEILGFLSACVNGNNIYLNRSFLAGKLNLEIANPIVNIIDDGLIPGGLGSRPFDSDGVPTRKTIVIENGILKSYLLGTYAARKLNMKSTGHSSGITNFILASGNLSQDALIKSIDKGILITSTIGHGLNPTTGDISKGAAGMMIINGELAYPVNEFTFSGNLQNILQNIIAIANDPLQNSQIITPSILVKELDISGK
ncbi:MAG TPA: TldD/PmbA family protein [Bacteroidota bacterium]|mgnify:CR=1 FL=1|nr:TldD/PmbA family protein [Bacteroidota bacterium]HRT67707.1 TldD/PmbA family protein [Bacteroidota bacterium]